MNRKDHSILERAWEYEIVGFNFQKSINGKFESFIDVTLQKDKEIRRLRFLSPIQLKIESGFSMTHGFCITDVSDKFLESKIEVEDFENGSIYFRARKVIDLDKTTETELEVLNVEFNYNLER